jgi:hypothetical protein
MTITEQRMEALAQALAAELERLRAENARLRQGPSLAEIISRLWREGQRRDSQQQTTTDGGGAD